MKTCGKENCDSQDCILNGKEYCLPEKKTPANVPIEGKDIVYEHLRQYFLFHQLKLKNNIPKWILYMNDFDDQLCMEQLDVKTCSNNIMSKYGNKDAVEAQVA